MTTGGMRPATTGGRSSSAVAAEVDGLARDSFTLDEAVALGLRAVDVARSRALPIVIEVRHGSRVALHAALPGSFPDSIAWIRRKGNVVERWQRSTLEMRLRAEEDGTTFHEAWGVSEAEFAAHGGGVPVIVRSVGMAGMLLISGLPQLDDHDFAVDVLRGA